MQEIYQYIRHRFKVPFEELVKDPVVQQALEQGIEYDQYRYNRLTDGWPHTQDWFDTFVIWAVNQPEYKDRIKMK